MRRGSPQPNQEPPLPSLWPNGSSPRWEKRRSLTPPASWPADDGAPSPQFKKKSPINPIRNRLSESLNEHEMRAESVVGDATGPGQGAAMDDDSGRSWVSKPRVTKLAPLESILNPAPVGIPQTQFSHNERVDMGFTMMQTLLHTRQQDEKQTALRSLFQKLNEAFNAIVQRDTSGNTPMSVMYSLVMEGINAIVNMTGGIGFFFFPAAALADFGFKNDDNDLERSDNEGPTQKQMYVFNTGALPVRAQMISKHGLTEPRFDPSHTPLFVSVLNGKIPRIFTRDDLDALQMSLTLPDGTTVVQCKFPRGHFPVESVLLMPLHEVDLKMTVLLGLANGTYTQDILQPLLECTTTFLRSTKVTVDKARVVHQSAVRKTCETRLRALEASVHSLFRDVMRSPVPHAQRCADVVSGIAGLFGRNNSAVSKLIGTTSPSPAEVAYIPIHNSAAERVVKRRNRKRDRFYLMQEPMTKGQSTRASSGGSSSTSPLKKRIKDFRIGIPVRSADEAEGREESIHTVLEEDNHEHLLRIGTNSDFITLSAMEMMSQGFDGISASTPVMFIPLRMGARPTGILILGNCDPLVSSGEYNTVLFKAIVEGFVQIEEQIAVEQNRRRAIQAQWSVPEEMMNFLSEECDRRDALLLKIDQERDNEMKRIVSECRQMFSSMITETFASAHCGVDGGEDDDEEENEGEVVEQGKSSHKSRTTSGMPQLLPISDPGYQRLVEGARKARVRSEAQRHLIRRTAIVTWRATVNNPIGLLMADLTESTFWEQTLGAEGASQLYTDLWNAFDQWVEEHKPGVIVKLKTIGDCVTYLSGATCSTACTADIATVLEEEGLSLGPSKLDSFNSSPRAGTPRKVMAPKEGEAETESAPKVKIDSSVGVCVPPSDGDVSSLVELGLAMHRITQDVWDAFDQHSREPVSSTTPHTKGPSEPTFRVSVVCATDSQQALPAIREFSGRLVFDMTGRLFSLSDRMTHSSTPGKGVLVSGEVESRLDQHIKSMYSDPADAGFMKGESIPLQLKGHGSAPKLCTFYQECK